MIFYQVHVPVVHIFYQVHVPVVHIVFVVKTHPFSFIGSAKDLSVTEFVTTPASRMRPRSPVSLTHTSEKTFHQFKNK